MGVKFTLPPRQRRGSWSGNPFEWAEMQIYFSFCVVQHCSEGGWHVPFTGKTGA